MLAAGIAAPAAMLGELRTASANDAREALLAKASKREAVLAAERASEEGVEGLKNSKKQLDAIAAELNGAQNWLQIRRTIGSKPLGNVRVLTKELAEEEPTRATQIYTARAGLLEYIRELDQFAYERQCKELAGYQVGPDKERVDPSGLLRIIDDAKKSLDAIIGA